MNGIFIPDEILEIEELNLTEQVVLAIYKYYTENGKNKCCSLNSHQIADKLHLTPRHMKRIRHHLKELGYIRTDGGIKVTYVRPRGDVDVPSDENGGDVDVPSRGRGCPSRGDVDVPSRGRGCPPKGDVDVPHKKDKEEEKRIKKEEKGDMTNFELLLDRLPGDYKTEERLTYLNENFKDRINNADISDGLLESWVVNIKNELNQVFPMEYKTPEEPEPVSKKTDWFDY